MAWERNSAIKQFLNIFSIGLSSAFLILIFPGFEVSFIAWIALVPLLLLIKHSGPVRTFLSSLAVGFIFYSALLWWILRTDGFNPFNFGLAVLVYACYLGVFGLLVYYFQKRTPKWNALTFPAAWVLLEYLRSHMAFLAFPWGILGYSQYSVPSVARISTLTGVYGVSFLIVLVNTLIADILDSCFFRSQGSIFRNNPLRSGRLVSSGILAGAVILLSASLLYGISSQTETRSAPSLKVALIQGNVYWEEGNDYRYRETIFETYRRLTLAAAESSPDLIAWPSSSVPALIPRDWMWTRTLSELARETRTFLLVGSGSYDKLNKKKRKAQKLTNSAFLFSSQGRILGRYDKIRLLPFDEYLPLSDYVKWPSWIVSDMTNYQPGKSLTVFKMKQARFGVLICWENMFPDLFRKIATKGVDFMVSMTNESFTDIPSAHYQMLAMNVFRAIENRLSIVRIAPTGVTAIIDPNGRIISRVEDRQKNDINVEGYLVGQIPLPSERTFYNDYGDWFVYSLAVMFIFFVCLAFFRKANREMDLNP